MTFALCSLIIHCEPDCEITIEFILMHTALAYTYTCLECPVYYIIQGVTLWEFTRCGISWNNAFNIQILIIFFL